MARRSEDAARAECLRAVFHAAGIDRHQLAGIDQGGGGARRLAADQPGTGAGQYRVDVAVIVATETEMLERPALGQPRRHAVALQQRSEEHTSELQSLMRISYAVFCLKKKKIRAKRVYKSSK